MKKLSLYFMMMLGLVQSALADKTESLGDVLQVMIPSIAYGSTFYMDDKEGEHQFYKSFAMNAVITYGVKYAVNRKRPNGGDYSFPSGHSSSAFQGASFIHHRYGIAYAIPAYMGATFVAYSRVHAKKHYKSDVVAGAILGSLSSFYLTTEYKNIKVEPTSMVGGYGVKLSYKW